MHFVHSVVLKNNQHRLFTKINLNTLTASDEINPSGSAGAGCPVISTVTSTITTLSNKDSPNSCANQLNDELESPCQTEVVDIGSNQQTPTNTITDLLETPNSSSSDDTTNPATSTWFIGKVLLKEFCIAKKVS